MELKEKAIKLLDEIRENRPLQFLEKIDYSKKGFHFVIGYLSDKNDEVIAGDLAKKLNVSTARIAVLLKKMESKGVIKKYDSKTDSRKTVVVLTEKGKIMAEEFNEALIEFMVKMINDVGLDDILEFVRISKKMKKSLEENSANFHKSED